MLFITHAHRISASQVFPFFYYRRELARRFDVELREVNVQAFENGRSSWSHRADIVCFQTWFDVAPDRLARLLDRIEQVCRPERTVYLDSFAPTDLRLAHGMGDRIDLYVKKHVFRDRSRYGNATRGDTNLMEYYGSRYGIDYPERLFPLPTGFLDKLIVGPSFVTAPSMMPSFIEGRMWCRPRILDVHARLGFEGTDWYTAMRREAIGSMASLRNLAVVVGAGIPHAKYLQELASSKICFSPFGYGEVAWRDYEAAMCGALILKPDMSHIETNPDIFVSGETYVPSKWDFSNVEHQVRRLLADDAERRRIAGTAFRRLHDYFSSGGFVEQLARVFDGER